MDSMVAALEDLVTFAKLENLLEVVEEEEKEISYYRPARQPTTADEADEAESSGDTDAAHSPPGRRQESASSGGADAAYYASWRQELHRRGADDGPLVLDAGPRVIPPPRVRVPPPPPPRKKSKKEADAADEAHEPPWRQNPFWPRGCEGSGGADAGPGYILTPPPPPPKKSKKEYDAGEDDAASWSPDLWTGRDEGYSDWSSDWWNCRAQSSGSGDWPAGYSRNGICRDPFRKRGGKCPRWHRAKIKAKQMDSHHGGDIYFQHFMSKYGGPPTSAAADAAIRFVEPYLQ